MSSASVPDAPAISRRAHEVSAKASRLRALIASEKLAGIVLRSQSSVAWIGAGLSNRVLRDRQESMVWVAVTNDGLYLISWDTEQIRLESEEGILELGFTPHYSAWPADEREVILRDLLPGGPWGTDGLGGGVDCSLRLRDLRSRLTDDEGRRLAMLSKEVTGHLEDALRAVRPGLRERDLAGHLAGTLEAGGTLPLVLLVGSGDRLDDFRHWVPTDLPIDRAVTATLAVERRGLVTVLSRTIWFDVEAARRRNQDKVMRVAATGTAATRVGASWGSALEEAVREYEACGYPTEWRRHFQGGAIGYDTREFSPGPTREPNEASQLLIGAGQAVAWNPTLPSVKSEDTYLISDDGPRLLTRTGEWPTVTFDDRGCLVEVTDVLVA